MQEMVIQRWCDGTRDRCVLSHVDAIKLVNTGVQARRPCDDNDDDAHCTTAGWICPNCGRENDPSDEECRWCQPQEPVVSGPADDDDRESPPPPPPDNHGDCSCCGRELGDDYMVVCPECGKVNDSSAPECSCCSHPLNDGLDNEACAPCGGGGCDSRRVCPLCHSVYDPHLTDAYHQQQPDPSSSPEDKLCKNCGKSWDKLQDKLGCDNKGKDDESSQQPASEETGCQPGCTMCKNCGACQYCGRGGSNYSRGDQSGGGGGALTLFLGLVIILILIFCWERLYSLIISLGALPPAAWYAAGKYQEKPPPLETRSSTEEKETKCTSSPLTKRTSRVPVKKKPKTPPKKKTTTVKNTSRPLLPKPANIKKEEKDICEVCAICELYHQNHDTSHLLNCHWQVSYCTSARTLLAQPSTSRGRAKGGGRKSKASDHPVCAECQRWVDWHQQNQHPEDSKAHQHCYYGKTVHPRLLMAADKGGSETLSNEEDEEVILRAGNYRIEPSSRYGDLYVGSYDDTSSDEDG